MNTEFTPLFLFILVAIVTAISMLVLSAILGPRKTTAVKQMPYESGMDPIGDARQRFDVRYYLVAIVFLLFDVELLFLYPWAVAPIQREPGAVAGGEAAAAASPSAWACRPSSAGWSSARSWSSSSSWRRPSLTPGEKGSSNGGRNPTTGGPALPPRRDRLDRRHPARWQGRGPRRDDPHQARRRREPGRQLRPEEQPLADALRHGLLRNRADGRRRQRFRHPPLAPRSCGSAPAMRPDDHRGSDRHEDDARPSTDLAADARAEMVHQHGRLRSTGGIFDTYAVVQGSTDSCRLTSTSPAARPAPSRSSGP